MNYAPPAVPDEHYKLEVLGIIQDKINEHPRSTQTQVGPSEIGGCERKLAWKLAYGGDGDRPGGWAAHKGTIMHSWLDETFKGLSRFMPDGSQRFFSDLKLAPVVPNVNGGTLDLYDLLYETVLDWKDLGLDTEIPTPTGWTTVGDVNVGDEVFDSGGGVCRVLSKTPVYADSACYRVTLDDGQGFVAGSGHLWNVVIDGTTKSQPYVGTTMTTRDIAHRLARPGKQRDCRIVNADFLKMPETYLPVDPYILGAWLGDGDSDSGRIGSGAQDKVEMEMILGVAPGPARPDGFVRFRIPGLTASLRGLGVLGNKRIPPQYMRAAYGQRLALVQGLMDTDGTWNSTRKAAVFSQKDRPLVGQVAELVNSLGWKAKIHQVERSGFGVSGTYYDISFVPFGDVPFRLKRKADQVRQNGSTSSQYRVIHSVEPVTTVPTQCITVDSKDSTFLVGRGMVPTHNCPGDGTMDKARAGNLSMGYYIQAQTYGLGLHQTSRPVRRVGLAFLPQCGDDLHKKAVFRFWPFDPDVAWAALRNVERIANMLEVASPAKVMEVTKTLSDFCQSCPAATFNGDRRAICPGAGGGGRTVNAHKDPFSR